MAYEGESVNVCPAIRTLAWGALAALIAAVLAIALMPSATSIDEGWLYIWIALAAGFLTGAGGCWYRYRRRR